MKMQISSMGEQYKLYCLETAKCANNGIQGNDLCDFTVFRNLNVGYGMVVWYFALAEWAETMSVGLAAEMPFKQIHEYHLQLELTPCKIVFYDY